MYLICTEVKVILHCHTVQNQYEEEDESENHIYNSHF